MDPLSLAHQYIVDALKNDTEVAAIVPEKNFFDLGTNTRINKQRLDTGDFPFILVEPTDSECNLTGTSTTGFIKQYFDIKVSFGDERLYHDTDSTKMKYLLPLKWQILKVLYSISGDQTISTWKYDFTLEDTVETRFDEELNKGKNGFATVMRMSANLFVPRSTLGS